MSFTSSYLPPFTAVAVNVYEQYAEQTGDMTPTVIASTASPYKFAKAVLMSVSDDQIPEDEFSMTDALSAKTGTAVPAPLASLRDAKERFSEVCDADEMPAVVLKGLSIG